MPSLYPLRYLRLGNEIVNIFDVRKMMESDVFPLVTSVGQRKNSHEESSLGPSDSAPRCSSTESQRLHGEWGLLPSSYSSMQDVCRMNLVIDLAHRGVSDDFYRNKSRNSILYWNLISELFRTRRKLIYQFMSRFAFRPILVKKLKKNYFLALRLEDLPYENYTCGNYLRPVQNSFNIT